MSDLRTALPSRRDTLIMYMIWSRFYDRLKLRSDIAASYLSVPEGNVVRHTPRLLILIMQ